MFREIDIIIDVRQFDKKIYGSLVELVDTLVLGTSA